MNFLKAISAFSVGSFKDSLFHWSDDFSVSEKLFFGLKCLLLGTILVLLIYIILSAASTVFSKAKNQKAEDKQDFSEIQQPILESQDENELAAIVSASIAASKGKSDCAFNVISITEIIK